MLWIVCVFARMPCAQEIHDQYHALLNENARLRQDLATFHRAVLTSGLGGASAARCQ